MPTSLRTQLILETIRLQSTLPFGPWDLSSVTETYAQFFGSEILIPATTLAQIVGGVNPSVAAITTIQLLLLYASQTIQVGLHGVNGQTNGFTVTANKALLIRGSINALNIYNTAAVAAAVIVAIGGP